MFPTLDWLVSNQIGKSHDRLEVISKEKRKHFLHFSFEHSQFTVILQTFLSGWCAPPPQKANYTVCPTLTQLYKFHNEVADTKMSHHPIFDVVSSLKNLDTISNYGEVYLQIR